MVALSVPYTPDAGAVPVLPSPRSSLSSMLATSLLSLVSLSPSFSAGTGLHLLLVLSPAPTFRRLLLGDLVAGWGSMASSGNSEQH